MSADALESEAAADSAEAKRDAASATTLEASLNTDDDRSAVDLSAASASIKLLNGVGDKQVRNHHI